MFAMVDTVSQLWRTIICHVLKHKVSALPGEGMHKSMSHLICTLLRIISLCHDMVEALVCYRSR